ncbi:hypothetical protein [Botrimarina sp.]|uniref:hypothetical protein n=1 Tax=Botrimarina sp. TaxID=2795802 RepID=UPI0032EF0EC8
MDVANGAALEPLTLRDELLAHGYYARSAINSLALLKWCVDPPEAMPEEVLPRGSAAAENVLQRVNEIARKADAWSGHPSPKAQLALAHGATQVGGPQLPGGDSNVMAVRAAVDRVELYARAANEEGIDLVRRHLQEYADNPDSAPLPEALPLYDFAAVKTVLNSEVAYAVDWSPLGVGRTAAPAIEVEAIGRGVAEALAPTLAALAGDQKAPPPTWRDKNFGTVNQRMMAAVEENASRTNLSKSTWAQLLSCSKTAVQESPMWGTIQKLRDSDREARKRAMRGATDPDEPVG